MLKKVLLPEDTLTSNPNLPRQLLWRHTFFRCLIWLAQWDLADTRSISHNIKSHRILFMYVRFCKWQLSLHMDTYLSSPVSSCKSHKVNLSAAYERCTDKVKMYVYQDHMSYLFSWVYQDQMSFLLFVCAKYVYMRIPSHIYSCVCVCAKCV